MPRKKIAISPPLVPAAVPASHSAEDIVAASIPVPIIIGVYCLVRAEAVVYVGQSKDVLRRIFEHRRQSKGRKSGCKTFDRIAVFPCETIADADCLEYQLIKKLQPELNLRWTDAWAQDFSDATAPTAAEVVERRRFIPTPDEIAAIFARAQEQENRAVRGEAR